MLPGWCCIAIAALELGNGDSWCHMCAFRFHFWGRKVNWNQASHVRASSVDLMRSSFWGGDVRPNLNLGFVLFKVGCPLRVIFNRGLEPKLVRSKHGSWKVDVGLALLTFSIHDWPIVKDCARTTSPQSLPQGALVPKPRLRVVSSLFLVMRCCCCIWRSRSSKHFQRKVRGTEITVYDWQNWSRDGLNPGSAVNISCNNCFEMLRSGWSVWRCFRKVLKSRGLRGRDIHHCHKSVCNVLKVGYATKESLRTRACREGHTWRVSCRSLPGWNTPAGMVMCLGKSGLLETGGRCLNWMETHAWPDDSNRRS